MDFFKTIRIGSKILTKWFKHENNKVPSYKLPLLTDDSQTEEERNGGKKESNVDLIMSALRRDIIDVIEVYDRGKQLNKVLFKLNTLENNIKEACLIRSLSLCNPTVVEGLLIQKENIIKLIEEITNDIYLAYNTRPKLIPLFNQRSINGTVSVLRLLKQEVSRMIEYLISNQSLDVLGDSLLDQSFRPKLSLESGFSGANHFVSKSFQVQKNTSSVFQSPPCRNSVEIIKQIRNNSFLGNTKKTEISNIVSEEQHEKSGGICTIDGAKLLVHSYNEKHDINNSLNEENKVKKLLVSTEDLFGSETISTFDIQNSNIEKLSDKLSTNIYVPCLRNLEKTDSLPAITIIQNYRQQKVNESHLGVQEENDDTISTDSHDSSYLSCPQENSSHRLNVTPFYSCLVSDDKPDLFIFTSKKEDNIRDEKITNNSCNESKVSGGIWCDVSETSSEQHKTVYFDSQSRAYQHNINNTIAFIDEDPIKYINSLPTDLSNYSLSKIKNTMVSLSSDVSEDADSLDLIERREERKNHSLPLSAAYLSDSMFSEICFS